MRIIFVEFEQITGVRQFMFDCISDEKLPAVRTSVSADLALARKYGISLQALPLLCRQLLESMPADSLTTPVSLTEECMVQIRKTTALPGSMRATRPRTPVVDSTHAWRRPATRV